MNEAIKAGGEAYFRYRQIELVPTVAPAVARALAQARLITVSGGGGAGAPDAAAQNMLSVIQTVLAAQLVTRGDALGVGDAARQPRNDGADAAPPGTTGTARIPPR